MTPEQLLALLEAGAASVADAEIATTRATLEAEAKKITAGIKSSDTPTEDAAEVERIVSFILELDNRGATREAAGTAASSAMSRLTTPPTDPEPQPEPSTPPAPPAEPATDPNPEGEAVTAAALLRHREGAETEPNLTGAGQTALVAAAGLENHEPGAVFTDRLSLADEMGKALGRLAPGGLQAAKATVAKIKVDPGSYDTELNRDGPSNLIKMLDLQKRVQKGTVSNEAITAAVGPFCAPAQVIYDFFDAPVAPLVTFGPTVNAPRGRIDVPISPSLADVTGDWLDVLGSQTAPKPCYLVPCGDSDVYQVTSYPVCLTFENAYRFYPELVDDVTQKSMARFGFVLQAAKLTAATAMADTLNMANAGGGALVTLYRALAYGAAEYRDRFFMPVDATLVTILPNWIPSAIATDIVTRDATLDFNVTRARVQSILESIGLDIRWAAGWQPLGTGGYESVNGGAGVRALMYTPGTIQELTGGTLDLGVQRSPEHNVLNQYQVFMEVWEGLAKVGYLVRELDGIILCPDGGTGDRDMIACNTGVGS